jgi:hypothetical protein
MDPRKSIVNKDLQKKSTKLFNSRTQCIPKKWSLNPICHRRQSGMLSAARGRDAGEDLLPAAGIALDSGSACLFPIVGVCGNRKKLVKEEEGCNVLRTEFLYRF